MKETFYFPHDYNASGDQKILMLRGKFGNEGYALFFYILETMAQDSEGFIHREAIGGLSVGYGVPYGVLNEFIEYCLYIKILKMDDQDRIYSDRMLLHKNLRKVFREKGKIGAKKRWSISQKNSPPISKERKGKEISNIITKDNNIPQHQEILNFFNQTCGTKLVLTPKKKTQLKERLKVFSVDQIKEAIENRTYDPWYQGENSSGKVWFNDWDSLFRNNEKIERALNAKAKIPEEKPSEEELHRRLDAFGVYPVDEEILDENII